VQCDVRCRIWWSEVRRVVTLTVCEMWHGTYMVCSNVMWNVEQWWCDVEWCGVEMCDVKGGAM